jgi:hypothetical protein
MKEVILVAGMPQSGSTLLYNIILNLFKHTTTEMITVGSKADCSATNLLTLHSSRKGIGLWKSHGRDFNCEIMLQHENIKIFTTRRDIRDCVASNIRKQKTQGLSNIADDYPQSNREKYIRAYTIHTLNAYNDWKDRSDFEFIYEVYKNGDDNKKISIILNIAQVLNLTPEISLAADLLHYVEVLLPTAVAQDIEYPLLTQSSMLSKGHITNQGIVGGYKDTLYPIEIKAIEELAENWLQQKGYMI